MSKEAEEYYIEKKVLEAAFQMLFDWIEAQVSEFSSECFRILMLS